jgi:nitrile hydratase accessory protein
MNRTAPLELPGLPRDSEGPVFKEPWEARAFAMALRLHERGVFTWAEWADGLSHEIAAAQDAGDDDRGDNYYQHWLGALEAMVARKGAACTSELARFGRAWANAALRTPHGSPIELRPQDLKEPPTP